MLQSDFFDKETEALIDLNVIYGAGKHITDKCMIIFSKEIHTYCIFRKNCASVPEERSAIPLQTEQSSAGLLVAIIYSTIPARKFKTICLGCHSA